jgi:iron complex outermembrane receptor protein
MTDMAAVAQRPAERDRRLHRAPGRLEACMTRPTLSDLSPRQSIQTNPGNETIRRGNPDLQPFRATQVELAAWNGTSAQDLAAQSAAAFYKNIDSFVTLVTTPQVVDQVTFQVTVPANGNGARREGLRSWATARSFNRGCRRRSTAWACRRASPTRNRTRTTRTPWPTCRIGLEGLSKYFVQPGRLLREGSDLRRAWPTPIARQVPAGGVGSQRRAGIFRQLTASWTSAPGVRSSRRNFTVFADGREPDRRRRSSSTRSRRTARRSSGPRAVASRRASGCASKPFPLLPIW